MEAGKPHPMLFILLGAFGLLTALILAPFWAFAVGGLLLGFIGFPIYTWLRGRVKGEGFAASLTLLALVVVLLIPAVLVGFQLTTQAQSIVSGLSGEEAGGAIAKLATYTHETFGWPETAENETAAQAAAEEVVPQVREAVLGWLPSLASYMAETLVGATVALFIGYYALRDGEALVDWVEDVMPLRPQTEKRLLEEGAETIKAVLLGQIATSAAIGVVGGIGFWITGVPAPVLWAFAMAVLSLLPVIGATIVWLPAAIFLLAMGNTWQGIVLLAWGALVVSSVDNVVKPMVIGKRSGMHPGIALLAAIGGLVAFGFMGFVIGPLGVAIFIILVNDYVEQRDLPEGRSSWRFEASEEEETRDPTASDDPEDR